MDENSNIRSVERALDILNCFTPEHTELTLTEISKQVGLALSTTSRILSTLVNCLFLSKDEETQKYSLGTRIAQLGLLCFSNLDFRKVAKPYMMELLDLYNESVSLFIVQGNYRVCVERVESTHPLRRVINIGDRLILTRGASGRLLLAYLEEKHILKLLENDPYTNLRMLNELRLQKYAVSKGEREKGVTSIAAPIFNAQNKVIATLAVSGPSVRFLDNELSERIEKIKEYANRISIELGYKEDI